MTKFYIKFIFVFACISACTFADDCFLKYATDFPTPADSVLLLKSSSGYDLIKPENEGIKLIENQEIAVACPGGHNNNIATVGSNFASGKCVDDKTLQIGTTDLLLNELGCNTRVTGEFSRTAVKCGSGRTGIIIHIGHKIEGNFKALFDVCYDDDKGVTLYANHVIYGSAINYSYKTNHRPSFKTGGLPSGVTGDEYDQKTQITKFARILGNIKLAKKYININANLYLARGHLAPDADMVYGASKYATYFYINVVPQWQKINNGNWKSLESCIRKLAGNLKEEIQIYTGTHEVLELEDNKGKPKEIYLATGKLPVPKFIWKVFYSLKTNKGIAFVSVNNPFAKDTDAGLYICGKDKKGCDNNSWGSAAWGDVTRGLVYCCEIDDLRNAVSNVPALSVSSVQKGLATKC